MHNAAQRAFAEGIIGHRHRSFLASSGHRYHKPDPFQLAYLTSTTGHHASLLLGIPLPLAYLNLVANLQHFYRCRCRVVRIVNKFFRLQYNITPLIQNERCTIKNNFILPAALIDIYQR